MLVILPSTITGDKLGRWNDPTPANRNSASVSRTISYVPVNVLGSVSYESKDVKSLFPTI